MNKNRNLRSSQLTYSSTRKYSTALILYVFCLQLFTFTLDAQTFKKGDDVKAKLPLIATPSSEKNKIAPDLESNANELIMGSRSDATQKVIIKMKPKDHGEKVDNGILLSDFASQDAMNSKLEYVGGKLNESFSNMEMISAELPLSKIREIALDENIEYISPDRTIQATAKKYSHYYKTTGALDGYSEVSGLQADGRGIGVAVLDSGIDITHKLIVPENGHPGVIYSKSFTGSSATDDKYGHGTHIASLLAGGAKFGKNAYGGIAPGVDLINLAVLDKKGRGTLSTAIAAIDWVIRNKSAYNIRVVNLSFGTAAVDSYVNDPLCQAVRRAFNAGIVVVVAAGNNGKDDLGNKMYGSINSPGIEPSAITVGAANSFGTDYRVDDTIASYSSKGPTRGFKVVNGVKKYDNLIKPDLVAPGNKLISAISNSSRGSSDSIVYKNPTLDTRNSSKSGEGLMYMSGSSMAAPLVSGAVAMMLQANPNLTPNLVKATLMYTAQQMNGYNSFEQGAGLLNIEGAMTITKYIRSNVSSLSNGASMVTGSNYPWNTLGNETVYWSKGIITNHAMLFGENLMTQYQGMYGNGVLISDSTPFINGQLTRSLTLTTSGLNISSGSLTGNGVLMSDGVPFLHSSLMGDGTTLGTGVLISDGVLVSDGVMISDNVASLSVLGDATAGMELDD